MTRTDYVKPQGSTCATRACDRLSSQEWAVGEGWAALLFGILQRVLCSASTKLQYHVDDRAVGDAVV